jgi:hypothetical protein
MCKVGDLPVIYMFFLFRPVENPAEDALCIEVWYVVPSVMLLYSTETLFILIK